MLLCIHVLIQNVLIFYALTQSLMYVDCRLLYVTTCGVVIILCHSQAT